MEFNKYFLSDNINFDGYMNDYMDNNIYSKNNEFEDHQIKDNNLNASFKSIEYDFEKRASGIIDSINESEYKYVVVSGCGEEHDVWNVTLNKLKE